jgi:Uma2 family endonuclease
MTRLEKVQLMTEEEYLKAEAKATVRHEYVNGHVFAMTGATDAHNVICGNIFGSLYNRLSDTPCRPYINDMKVRIEQAESYYYPDIMVSCEPFEPKSVSKSKPVLIIEVLSPGTAAIDRREKLIAYKKIASLREYVLVYQNKQRVELYRRNSDGQWEFEVLTGEDVSLESLPNGPFALPFSVIYKDYNPPLMVKESEEFLYSLGGEVLGH